MKLIRLKYRKYPKLIEALADRHNQYNETSAYINEKEASGEILVIRPPEELPIGRMEHDPERIKAAYEIGRRTGLKYIEKVKEFLNKEEV